ncbi:hypothetical protein [Methylobacterium sp. sgz302541]|uniref:hypothetical protein n=1 Tax=unclassified Methylobacterium TaxID=2615210 RepID=UPI003D3328E4
MTTGNPFGIGLPVNLRPEDIAALMSRVPMAPAQGFTPPDAPQTDQGQAPQAAIPVAPAPAAQPMPLAPPVARATPPAPDPAPTTGSAPSAAPSPIAQPPAKAADAGGESGGFLKAWKALADTGLGDQALAFGAGLLSAPGGEGWGKAFDNLSRVSATSATTDLAKQKLAQEQAKLARETAGENATRQYLLGKGFDPNLATAAMSSPIVLQSVLAQMNKDPSRVTIGGNIYELKPGERPGASNMLGSAEASPDAVRAKAQAQAEGTAAGKPDDTFSLVPDQERVQLGLPAGAYQKDSKGKITPINPPGGTSVNIDLGKKANQELDSTMIKGIDESRQKALGAVQTIDAINRQKQSLESGIVAGWGADWRTQARAAAAQILGIPDDYVKNSQLFDQAATQKAAALAKAISQSGHTTNMDLQFGKTISSGDRSSVEAALRAGVEAQELLAKEEIKKHNDSVDRFVGVMPEAKDRAGWFRVQQPEIYQYQPRTPDRSAVEAEMRRRGMMK